MTEKRLPFGINKSRRILNSGLVICLCLGLISGCVRSQPDAVGGAAGGHSSQYVSAQPQMDVLPDAMPLEFIFSSGAGAWRTFLTLNQDGSFIGQYTDSEMGEAGPTYPRGTVYISTFSGQFGEIKKLDDVSYSLTLTQLDCQGAVGDEAIDEEIRYVTAAPYGVEKGTQFTLYTPDVPIDDLSQDFLNWYQLDEMPEDVLSQYGLFNVAAGYGFFTES